MTKRIFSDRLLGVVFIGLLVLGVWLINAVFSQKFVSFDKVELETDTIGLQLPSRADVKVRGVIVGKVDGITRGPEGGVRVKIALRDGRLDQVPGNVVARILPATVFGTSYVDLVTPGGPSSKPLRAGAVIPADTTQGTLELQQALDDIDALVKALGPAELASAIGSVAQALDGRGSQLGDTIDLADDYLARLNPKMPQVREDVRKLAANLELLAEVSPDLLAATDDALATARTVVAEQAAIATVLIGATALTTQADAFLRAQKSGLIRFIQNSALLLDVVHANRAAGISGAIATNTMVAAKLATVVQHCFVDTVTTFLLDVPPYYTAANCPRVGAARGDNCGSGR